MSKKNVELVASPREPHFVGDGFRVHNFIPYGHRMDMQRMDPFIMLDYNSKFHFAPSEHPRGVGVHPHKGFETVTIAYKGRIEHGDSTGGGGVICEGDVQWMTAASGVLHKEFHEREWSKNGGAFQMVQLWVNLPAKHKQDEPRYQLLQNKNMAKVALPDYNGVVEIIAGEYQGKKGSAKTFSPIHLYNVKLKKGKGINLDFPVEYATAILMIEDSAKVNNKEVVPQDHFALFKKEGENFSLEAIEDATVLVLGGAPLHEPIAAHGPFVMNTRAELIQAFDDFNKGKFGYLED